MKLLKFNIFPFICGLILLSSCVDDGIVNTSWKEQGNTTYYVKLKLKTSNSTFTRAEEEDWSDPAIGSGFQDGFHDEHAIAFGGNFAIFFDKEDKYISCADLYSINETGTGTPDIKDDKGDVTLPGSYADPSPESYYTARFYGFADRQPAKVLVVVNCADDIKEQITDFPGWTLEEVMKRVWERNGTYGTHTTFKSSDDPLKHLGFRQENGKTYFAMTNATYLKPDENGDMILHCAEDILPLEYKNKTPSGNLTTDETKIDDLTPVTVTLERMVSKFSFNIVNNTGEYLPYNADALDVCQYIRDADDDNVGKFTYTDYKWAVQVLGWGVNGLERSNYLFKNVDPDGEYFEEERDWGWNSTYNKRCYWSEDPHYTKEEAHYPWQFRDAKDKNNDQQNNSGVSFFRNYNNPEEGEPFSLTYYPFTKFIRNVDDDGVLYQDEKKTIPVFENELLKNNFEYHHNDSIFYSPENTYQPGIVVDRTRASRAYELAGTHILLLCQLRIDLDGNNQYNHTPENIYRNRVGVSYINPVDMFEDFMNAVNYKLTSQKYLYYNYSPWKDEDNKRHAVPGDVFRAKVGGSYALYYYNSREKEYRELTYQELNNINNRVNSDKSRAYELTMEAENLNGDGKVLPWICYRESKDEPFNPLDLYILQQNFESSEDFLALVKQEDEAEMEKKDRLSEKLKEIHKRCSHIDPNTNGEIIDIDDLNPTTDEEGGSSITFTTQDFQKYIHYRRVQFQYYNPNKNVAEGSKEDKWEDLGEDENGVEKRDRNDLRSVFFEIWGVADHFNHGLMYYAIPIEALTKDKVPAITDWVNSDMKFNSDVPEPAKTDDNYKKFYGYHGVVRNNWYNFTLRTINDIGIPVSDPKQPIVPNYHKKLDQTKVEMEILQWHVEDQTVPLF